jgi:putative CRISPR-associated protein (TIGR02619 family)
VSYPLFVLSPCGTSLLTNQVSDLERKLVGKYANTKQKSEIPSDDRQQLEDLIVRVADKVASADFQAATRMSAELNAIIKLYDGQTTKNNDYHQLICTDTWLGETTANFVATWLQKQGLTAQVKRQVDLQTKDINAFQLALSEIVEWCEQTIPGYKRSGYRIIFNLTGGFKSVQGFLQTLAAFYADETIYIFETATDLLRIPRLPVEMNPSNTIRDNLEAFRKLAMGLDTAHVDRIPETLLMKVDGKTCFSSWGDLVWKNTKDKIYQERLHPPLSDRLKFGVNFERSIKGILPDRLVLVNNRIDQLSKFLETNGEYNPPSLDFKPLKGAGRSPSTHEVDAWNDRDAQRIFGHYEGNIFILDILDMGLH